MAFQTFKKSGKRSKLGSKPDKHSEKDVSPSNMYGTADFGGGRPDPSRRMSGNYGKTSSKRNENDPLESNNDRQSGRMFNWIKGNSY